MNSVAANMRGLRAKEMRAQLTDIALRLFDDMGYDAVGIDSIAAAAGISPRTFFRYFESKDEILLQYERSLHTRLLAALARRPPEEGPVTALRNAYSETSATPPDARAHIRRRGALLADSPSLRTRASGERASSVDDISAVLAQRRGPGDTSTPTWRLRVIAAALSAVAAEAWARWIDVGGDTDPAESLAAAFALLTSGWESRDE